MVLGVVAGERDQLSLPIAQVDYSQFLDRALQKTCYGLVRPEARMPLYMCASGVVLVTKMEVQVMFLMLGLSQNTPIPCDRGRAGPTTWVVFVAKASRVISQHQLGPYKSGLVLC